MQAACDRELALLPLSQELLLWDQLVLPLSNPTLPPYLI